MSSTLALHVGSTDLDFARSHAPVRHQKSSSNGSVPSHWFQSGLPTPPFSRDMTGVTVGSRNGNYSSNHSFPHAQPNNIQGGLNIRSNNLLGGLETSHSTQDLKSRPSTVQPSYHVSNGSRDGQIASHLQIPESVNSSRGSLAEFAAELTCLFWFESASTIEYAEDLALDMPVDRGLAPDATPTIGFRKWVTTILSTTQVGKNVILLALMFIYRLKKFNPNVSGKRGSEFRLLTIALMLGNKFLDDNTYTNKTWAEVSGISVNEIHIMEVEFLSNMRYELYASEGEWLAWKSKLGRFSSFYEKAIRYAAPERSKTISPTTPTSQIFPHKLPSPPSASHTFAHLQHPLNNVPHLPKSPAKLYNLVDHFYERKRSLDVTTDLPPAKRMHFPTNNSAQPSPVTLTPNSAPFSEVNGMNVTSDPFLSQRVPQLPMPRPPYPQANQAGHMPPLPLPANRAMASVYTNPQTSYSQPVTPISAAGPNLNQLGPALISSLGDGSRVPSHPGSAQTSPINLYGTATPTRPGLSPSYILMNRSSPYRPVRNVNTLLIPPPSAAMHNQVKPIGYDQIHYQPLSKSSSQTHTGPVPFLQPDAWQSHVSTPLQYRQY